MEFLPVGYFVNMYTWHFMANIKAFCLTVLLYLCSGFYNTEGRIRIKFSK